MIFSPASIDGLFRVDLQPVCDERGSFARAWCRREFAAYGIDEAMVQANLAYTYAQGTLRGLHFQAAPYEETKFVRCVRGSAYVVVADLRPDSATYARWAGFEISESNRTGLLVPKGCAQGYQTLRDDTEMLYQMSTEYAPGAARGVRYDDPAFGIQWPLPPRHLSEKDLSWPAYAIEIPERCCVEH